MRIEIKRTVIVRIPSQDLKTLLYLTYIPDVIGKIISKYWLFLKTNTFWSNFWRIREISSAVLRTLPIFYNFDSIITLNWIISISVN
jgi:hypothetical protein